MKKLILFIFIAVAMVSCKKPYNVYTYSCIYRDNSFIVDTSLPQLYKTEIANLTEEQAEENFTAQLVNYWRNKQDFTSEVEWIDCKYLEVNTLYR